MREQDMMSFGLIGAVQDVERVVAAKSGYTWLKHSSA